MERDAFMAALAEMLAGPPAMHASISAQMGRKDDLLVAAWFKLRHESGLFGYPTVEEAKAQLEELL